MKRLLIALVFLFAATVQLGHADRKHEIVFEATVLRIDYWGLVKYSCGVAINYRLAEYKVDRVERGSFSPGDRVVVRHLACNWNELDDLKVDDKVVVTVVRLKHPEKTSWQTKLDSKSTAATPKIERMR